MSYGLRNYRHRNPKTGDDKKTATPFFGTSATGAVQKKKKGEIQRLATSKEDEKLGTNDARMEKDKEEPMKPVQKKDAHTDKEKKEPVQKAEAPGDKKKEKKLQKAEDPEKKKKKTAGVQKKEAPGIQRCANCENASKKDDTTSHKVADEINKEKGKGSPLPPKLLAEMSKSYGMDLSNVRIHTDVAANKLCHELHALAFTHGADIFFSDGKFNPQSPEGKLLLAHELTHVVQQHDDMP